MNALEMDAAARAAADVYMRELADDGIVLNDRDALVVRTAFKTGYVAALKSATR